MTEKAEWYGIRIGEWIVPVRLPDDRTMTEAEIYSKARSLYKELNLDKIKKPSFSDGESK